MLDCLIHETISLSSVRQNTVLEVRSYGMDKPTLGSGTNPSAPIPLNRFLRNNQWHVPSTTLEKIFDCIANLQDTAFEKGCPHWIFLENRHKPKSWQDRAATMNHSRSGPDDIKFPPTDDMPRQAVEWIKNCVREAAALRQPVPDLNKIPEHAVDWVGECIEEGIEYFEGGGNINYLGIDYLVWPVEEYMMSMAYGQVEQEEPFALEPEPEPQPFSPLVPPGPVDNQYNFNQTAPQPVERPDWLTAEEWEVFLQGEWAV